MCHVRRPAANAPRSASWTRSIIRAINPLFCSAIRCSACIYALSSCALFFETAPRYWTEADNISVYLKNLIELGIIERGFSISESIKEKTNSNKGLYRITDNFFRFWYAFVFTNMSELEGVDVDGVYKYSVEPLLHEFAATPFEDVCREYVRELQKAGKLPFRYSEYFDATAKLSNYKDKAEFYYYLFSESGFDDKIVEESGRSNGSIVLCGLDDIVNFN